MTTKVAYTDIFFSPHYDDAVLSLGGLMGRLQKDKRKLLVVTLFTQGSWPPYTLPAWNFLIHSSQILAPHHFNQRRKENTSLFNSLRIDFVDGGLTDGYFRRHHLHYYYPNHPALTAGKIAVGDTKTLKLATKIIEHHLLKLAKGGRVYGPLGVGGHVDHILSRCALVRQVAKIKRLYLWQDMPYWQNGPQPICNLDSEKITLDKKELETKMNWLDFYESQQHIIQSIPQAAYQHEVYYRYQENKNLNFC